MAASAAAKLGHTGPLVDAGWGTADGFANGLSSMVRGGQPGSFLVREMQAIIQIRNSLIFVAT